MSELKETVSCKHCEKDVVGNFCTHCGHPRELERISGKYILSEISNVLNFHKGILYTIRELLIRPGLATRTFILEDRNRLVKPIIFLIICSLIYTILEQLFLFEEEYVNYSEMEASTAIIIFEWVKKNYGYANIIMAFFIGFWVKILFKKYDYNFFEILILLCFVMGIGMLIYAVFGVSESVMKIKVMHIGGIIGFIYSSWAIGQFFDKRKIANYIKAFLAYILGMVTCTITLFLIGILVDLVLYK